MSKLKYLEENGLKLLATNMLKTVRGEPNLYEVVGGQCRVITYCDRTERDKRFVLLHGFVKKKQRQSLAVAEGRRLLNEYLSRRV